MITALSTNTLALNVKIGKYYIQRCFVLKAEYGSTIYYPKLNQRNKNKIKKEQRKMLLNVISAYRMVSYIATNVIARILPIDLLMEKITEI